MDSLITWQVYFLLPMSCTTYTLETNYIIKYFMSYLLFYNSIKKVYTVPSSPFLHEQWGPDCTIMPINIAKRGILHIPMVEYIMWPNNRKYTPRASILEQYVEIMEIKFDEIGQWTQYAWVWLLQPHWFHSHSSILFINTLYHRMFV